MVMFFFFFFLPRIKNTGSGFSESAKFMMSLSIDIQDGRDRIAAIKKKAFSTSCNKRWAGLMEMMALSSVIGHMIYSVYPTRAPLFHGPIVLRMGSLQPVATSCGPVTAIWTKMGPFSRITLCRFLPPQKRKNRQRLRKL